MAVLQGQDLAHQLSFVYIYHSPYLTWIAIFLLRCTGMYNDAVTDCMHAIQKDPDFHKAYLRRARAYRVSMHMILENAYVCTVVVARTYPKRLVVYMCTFHVQSGQFPSL